MRIFIAGATGVLGQRLGPMLIQRGHEVTGMTRSPAKAAKLRADGADAAIADAFDRDAVRAAVQSAEPEVVVHELTALSDLKSIRNLDSEFELTNRLRTEGTDHLLAAARAANARRFVAQSFTGWPYERRGGWVKAEDDPLDPDPPARTRRTLDAIRHLEAAVLGAAGIEGLVLRYGGFYGPGTSIAPDGLLVREILRRRFPIVGQGTGVWSFVHIDDAATATVDAIERGDPGIYNIVDDDPAAVSAWLPALAESAGAKPPMRIPAWLGRLMAGEPVVVWMNEIRGASNAKAKRVLGWHLGHPTWRRGFRDVLDPEGGNEKAAA